MSGRAEISSEAKLRFGIDTGGTFTDLVIEGLPEGLRFFKRPTTPTNPIVGLLDVISHAASELGLTTRDLLGRVSTFVYGTTHATNAIVEGKTARTAFLTTKGHRDILYIREGGGRVGSLDYSQNYPEPYVPRALTFEISERIRSDGSVRTPLDEQAVIEVAAELKGKGVEAVAVCLLWSVINPEHEECVGALLEKHLPGVPYTLSHRLNPTVREYRRASSAAIDASLKPLMSAYFRKLDQDLRNEGFNGRLLVLTGSGGVLDAADIWNTPIHVIGSGPAAAPVAGRYFAKLDAGSDYAVVTDAGGTTYDVSLIRRGAIPWTRETLVGPVGARHITGFPSVDSRSIGAGGGSIGWVDRGGLLHVGPQSAGAEPGPACWGRGGTKPTVTDACLVLGYIDPDYFLGGAMRVDRAAAIDAIMRDVGTPLGMDVQTAASAIFQLACERMVTAIDEITLRQGIDVREAAVIGGGGGAGLYSATIARRLGAKRVIIPAVSAALSAAGALLSDLTQDFTITAPTTTRRFDFALSERTLGRLRTQCETFVAGPGAGSVQSTIGFSVEARYLDQVWEIEVPLRDGHLATDAEVEAFRQDFHRVHNEIFAVNDENAQVEIVTWRAHVRCVLGHRNAAISRVTAREASAAKRPAHFDGYGEVSTAVRRYESIGYGERLQGPVIIETPVTTVVVPPDADVVMLPSGSLSMEFRAAAASTAEIVPLRSRA